MNTALLLLLFVALAAIPGSILPQKTASLIRVNNWKAENPDLASLFENISFFDVYGSVWFSAIYILLMISIIGCVIPRLKVYFENWREKPSKTPNNISNFSNYQKMKINKISLKKIEQISLNNGWRTYLNNNSLTIEKGFSREAGNLLFHFSLIIITVALAFGALFSYRGTVVVRENTGFSNTITQYDDFRAGRFFSETQLPNFFFTLNDFIVDFERSEIQRGAPRKFEANITLNNEETFNVYVNKPINILGTKIFLTGHGYAPVITVKNKNNQILFSDSVVFLPQDGNFSSTGVVNTNPQLGIEARFLPTATVDPVTGPTSTFPALDNPEIFMSLWQGDLGVNSGISQSIYKLDTSKMTQIGLEELSPGQSWITDSDYVISFDGIKQFVSFQIAYEPGRFVALVGAVLAMVGMIFGLGVQRRKIFIKMPAKSSSSNVIEIAGIAKENHNLEKDILKLLSELGLKKSMKVSREI
jgi:cytochrome c biogenesis protein